MHVRSAVIKIFQENYVKDYYVNKIMKLYVFVAVLVGSVQFANADDGGLSVTDVWARPVILLNRPGTAYFTVTNKSDKSDVLAKVSSTLAERVEIHLSTNEGGVMKMQQVGHINIPPNGTVSAKPGGYHLMLFGLKKKLAVGDLLPLRLRFLHAGDVNVMAKVMKMPMKMDHGKMMQGMGKH